MKPQPSLVLYVKSILVGLCLFLALELNASAQTKFYLGITKLEAYQIEENTLIRETIKRLEKKLTHYQLITIECNPTEFSSLIRQGRLHAFITTADLFRQHTTLGLRDIAVSTFKKNTSPSQTFGATFLTRFDRDDLLTTKDLKGKLIGVLEGDFLKKVTIGEIHRKLRNKNSYRLVQLKTSAHEALRQLKSKKLDALSLPVCALESRVALLRDDLPFFKLLNPVSHMAMACLHSSVLYPSLVFGSTPRTPSNLVLDMTIIVSATKTKNLSTWKVGADFLEVDQLLRELNLDEHALERIPSFTRFFQIYKNYFIALALLFLIVFIHILVLRKQVSIRTIKLQKAVKTVKKFREESARTALRLEKIQKMGLIGQMSSMFAHEIRQPLNAIECYLYTLREMQVQRQVRFNQNDTKKCIEGIAEQTERIDSILQRSRDYIRSKRGQYQSSDLGKIILGAKSSFESTIINQHLVNVRTVLPKDPVLVKCDRFEIEIALVNVLRNAAEAQSKGKVSNIEITLMKTEDEAIIQVVDDGPKITSKKLQQIQTPITDSSKPDGLGVGLALVRYIIEKHNASIVFTSGKKKGLTITITLPAE